MNTTVFEGKWKQIHGQAKVWWGELTHDGVEKVGGRSEKLIGLLQEKYGATQKKLKEENKK